MTIFIVGVLPEADEAAAIEAAELGRPLPNFVQSLELQGERLKEIFIRNFLQTEESFCVMRMGQFEDYLKDADGFHVSGIDGVFFIVPGQEALRTDAVARAQSLKEGCKELRRCPALCVSGMEIESLYWDLHSDVIELGPRFGFRELEMAFHDSGCYVRRLLRNIEIEGGLDVSTMAEEADVFDFESEPGARDGVLLAWRRRLKIIRDQRAAVRREGRALTLGSGEVPRPISSKHLGLDEDLITLD